jgi:hypothetical protein
MNLFIFKKQVPSASANLKIKDQYVSTALSHRELIN